MEGKTESSETRKYTYLLEKLQTDRHCRGKVTARGGKTETHAWTNNNNKKKKGYWQNAGVSPQCEALNGSHFEAVRMLRKKTTE